MLLPALSEMHGNQGHDVEQATERSHLLPRAINGRRLSEVQREEDVASIISSHLSKQERALADTPIGERLPYNDYTTIDWLHDLVGLILIGRWMNVTLTKIPGQGFLPLPIYTLSARFQKQGPVDLRCFSRLDSCHSHRSINRLCGLPCRPWSRHNQ